MEIGVSAWQWIPNTLGVVKCGNDVATVSDEVINNLKLCVKSMEESDGPDIAGLKSGDTIKITHGPLAGYEAIFDMRLSVSDRVQVLLDILGREVKARVNANMIKKTSQH